MTVIDYTILAINGISFPRASARGMTQTLAPIVQASQLQRTVDGDLDDLSLDQFQKYASEITCRDYNAPALDGIFPGRQIVVDCIPELAYEPPTDEVVLGENANRDVVPGSAREEDGFVFYRPRLTMRVIDFQMTRDEYGSTMGWTLRLEEV